MVDPHFPFGSRVVVAAISAAHPYFNLYNREWPIYTTIPVLPPAKFVFEEHDRVGRALNSIVSPGAIISGGRPGARSSRPVS